MLCGVCDEGQPTSGDTCPRCGGALTLNGRYSLERLLGAGGQSRVYAGRDAQSGDVVAVKIMSLARVREWKNVELFRRAASVLGGLHHPGIPRLVEYFEETRPSAALYCLVHELIDGETLAAAQKGGLRFDEQAAEALLRELLAILKYLHGLSPPVIHRDIKPSNLMRARDGRLVLIDFDLVRDVMMPDGGATTTAGTAGYTPIEQYAGEATPASDLYAAGATLAALLSRKEPLELRAPGEQRLALASHIRVGKRLLGVLQKMVAPEAANRYQNADEVLAALDVREPSPKPKLKVTVKVTAPSPNRMPLVFVSVILLGGALGAWALLTSDQRPTASPPAVTSSAPAAVTPRAVTPAVPPRAAPTPDALVAVRLTPEGAASALVAAWDGSIDDKTHIQVRVTGSGTKLKGQLTTFESRGKTLTPLKIDIAALGTVTLRGRSVEDGVAVERTFYGEFTANRATFFGTRETRYDASGGSSYVTEDKFTLQRSP